MENAECRLYIGSMFSEKTSEILRQVKRARIADIPCVIIKYARDNRYSFGPVITTHDGTKLESGKNLRIIEAQKLEEVKLLPHEQIVAIDEGQFYPDIHIVVDKWMKEGKKIFVSALDGDYRRKPFGKIGELIPLCTHIVKLHAVCMMCKRNNGCYTLRTVKNKEIELIGSNDKYMAVCFKCYVEANTNYF